MNTFFCPKCGTEIEKLYGTLCNDCFFEGFILSEIKSVIHIKICPSCKSVFDRNKWSDSHNIDELVIESVEKLLFIHNDAKVIEIYIEPIQRTPHKYFVSIVVNATVMGTQISKKLNSEVRIVRESCDRCSRMSAGYFEGIVQIRGTNRVLTDDEKKMCVDITNATLNQMQKKGVRLAFISNSIDFKDGIDLYIGSNSAARHICKAISSELGGTFSESPKLFGQRDGKNIYRITFLIRLFEFRKGDVILFKKNKKEQIIEIKSSGKRIKGIDLESDTRFNESIDDMKNALFIANINDAVKTTIVAVEKNDIMILDPISYETITIKKPQFFDVENDLLVLKTEYGVFAISN